MLYIKPVKVRKGCYKCITNFFQFSEYNRVKEWNWMGRGEGGINITSVISALAEAENDMLTAKLLLCVLQKSDQAIIERINLN